MADPNWRDIPIAKLTLDEENPRIDENDPRLQSGADEIDIVLSLIALQEDKILNLAGDLVANGPNPAELPIVMATDDESDRYIVLEGNRRVAAIKIMADINLISGYDNERVKSKFSELAEKFAINPITEIRTVVVDDRSSADHWMELRHDGEQGGAGTVRWGSEERNRWRARKGVKAAHLQVLDYVRSSGTLSDEEIEKTRNIATTNLSRLISDPYVRGKLGIDKKKGNVTTRYSTEEVLCGLRKIIMDLATKKIIVDDIYYKSDRADYINQIGQNYLPDTTKPLSESRPLGDPVANSEHDDKTGSEDSKDTETKGGPSDNEDPEDSKIKSKEHKNEDKQEKETPHPDNRSTLIPQDYSIPINQSRCNEIYHELKGVNVDLHKNAVAVLFRVFLELSVDHYIDENGLQNVSDQSSLSHKLHSVASHMEDNDILNSDELRPVRRAAENKRLLVAAVSSFHAYVHSRFYTPVPGDLKATWNSLGHFFRKVWV